MLTTISPIFTDTLGSWVGVLFLLFAALALFKTVLANVPSLSRRIAAPLAVFGLFDWDDRAARDRWLRVLIIGLPISWGLLGVVVSSPLALVVPGGILNALYLMAVSVTTLYLSFRRTDPRVKDSRAFTAYSALSALAVFAVGALALPDYL